MRFLSLTLIAFVYSSGALAEADCSQALTNDSSLYESNTVVWLAYVKNILSSKAFGSQQGFQGSYAGIGLGFNDAKNLYETMTNQQNYNFSKQQSISILRSTLSDNSVQAYLACIHADRGVSIILPEASQTEKEYQIQIKWDPNHSQAAQTLTVTTSENGEVVGTASKTVNPQSKSVFLIRRKSMCEGLTISAAVGDDNDLISLPRLPNFVIRHRVAESREYNDDRHNQTTKRTLLCVDPGEQTYTLLPSSLRFDGTQDGDAIRMNADPKHSNGLEACMAIEQGTSCSEDKCNTKLHGRVKAIEFYAEKSDLVCK